MSKTKFKEVPNGTNKINACALGTTAMQIACGKLLKLFNDWQNIIQEVTPKKISKFLLFS